MGKFVVRVLYSEGPGRFLSSDEEGYHSTGLDGATVYPNTGAAGEARDAARGFFPGVKFHIESQDRASMDPDGVELLKRMKKQSRPKETPWTLDEALALIREVNPLLMKNGWYLALTGSVLFRGDSDKDLDLIAYPADSTKVDHSRLEGCLQHSFGWDRRWDSVDIHGFWRRAGSHDRKHVEAWYTKDDKRIDLFILT